MKEMLRIYLLQRAFELPDPGAEDAIYDSSSVARRYRMISISRASPGIAQPVS